MDPNASQFLEDLRRSSRPVYHTRSTIDAACGCSFKACGSALVKPVEPPPGPNDRLKLKVLNALDGKDQLTGSEVDSLLDMLGLYDTNILQDPSDALSSPPAHTEVTTTTAPESGGRQEVTPQELAADPVHDPQPQHVAPSTQVFMAPQAQQSMQNARVVPVQPPAQSLLGFHLTARPRRVAGSLPMSEQQILDEQSSNQRPDSMD